MTTPRFSRLVLVAALVGPAAAALAAQESLEARGERLAKERCAGCHGIDGRGSAADYPSLAGQHAEYIVKQIFHFKTGQRINPVMMPVIDKLMAVDIRALSQHFAALRPGTVPSSDEALLAEGRGLYFRGNANTGIPACAACHGVYATGGAQMPRLAGQHPVYLEKQLRGFIQKTRHNDRLMHFSLTAMSEREIKAVAAYLGNEE